MQNLPKFSDENLIIGSEDFSDAGVYRLRDDLYIVQTLDFFPPLVDDPYLFGKIAASNSLSDVYAMGASPTTAMNIVGFPDDQLELSILNEILKGGADQVLAAGAVLMGGHTVRDVEIKYGLSVTGVVTPEKLLSNSKAQVGDAILLTKPLGTGFVTTAYKKEKCPQETFKVAAESMAMLNKVACEAAQEVGVHAMTDITGFGLVGHAREMADASDVTISLQLESLPILPGSKDLVKNFKTRASHTNRSFAEPAIKMASDTDKALEEFIFDAQTSGGLLISVPADQAESLLKSIQSRGAESSAIIGSVEERKEYSLSITN